MPDMKYHFSGGWEYPEKTYRPNHCDTCKTPTMRVRQAPNSQGIRCLMCDKCLQRFKDYMKKHYWNSMSVQDACSSGCLTRMHLHGDDPVPSARARENKAPVSIRQKIKKKLQELEMQRLVEA